MATRNGVEYDLRQSPYESSRWPYLFRFSSQAHRDKFNEKAAGRVEWLNDSMTRRFHLAIDLKPLALFQLYMQVETRGFLVRDVETGVWYDCPQTVRFDGLQASESGFSPLRESTTTLSARLLG